MTKAKTIEVTGCRECPFRGTHLSGLEWCRELSRTKGLGFNTEVKNNQPHKECPLKNQPITVKLKK